MQPISAVLSQGKIIVPTQSDADSLNQKGYGYRKQGTHILPPIEALYNLQRGKITITDEASNRQLQFQELLRILSKKNPTLWTNYIIFKDLRTRGFITKKDGNHFHVYERGTYRKKPPRYQIYTFSEGKPQRLKEFMNQIKTTETQGYELKIAVVDRRGEIVYYTVKKTDLLKK